MNNVLRFIQDNWAVLAILISVFVLLAILVYISLKIREYLIKKVVYTRTFTDSGAYEGETTSLVETVYNPTPFPLLFVNIEGYIYNGLPIEQYEIDPRRAMQYYVSRFNLMPFMQIKRKHTIKCAKRGYYKLETVDIYYNKKVRYIEAPADFYVYPKIVPLGELSEPNCYRQGESFTRRWLIRDPFSLNGIRDYSFGDPFNSINFKATARSGSLNLSAFKVNNRDFCSSRTFMVYLNFQTDLEVPISTSSYEAMMELGLSFSSAIIRDAAYNGYRAGFAANCCVITGEDSIRFPVQSGETHLEEILREMAKVRHKVGISLFNLLEHDVKSGLNDTEIYIITPYVNDTMDEQIAHLRRSGNNVTVLKLEDEERMREEHEARELQKAKAERDAENAERLKNSTDRQALEKLLKEQEALEEKSKKEKESVEAEKRRIENEARRAALHERTEYLRQRQAHRDSMTKTDSDDDGDDFEKEGETNDSVATGQRKKGKKGK